jgi:hypothetical protein
MKEHCNIAVIYLTQDQITVVDIWNYEWLNQWKWFAQKHHTKHRETFYAVRHSFTNKNGGRTNIRMHRLISNAPRKLVTDHINGNTLINLESNLRNITNRQNCQNRHHPRSSKYPGVSWYKATQKWEAQIEIDGNKKYLGYFDSEEKAYERYCKELEKIK